MLSNTMKSLFFKSLRSQQIAFLAVVPLLFVTVITLALYEGNKDTVTLIVNGKELEVKTYAQTVGELLAKQEIEITEHDLVIPSVNTPVEDGLSIRWEQSKQVALTVDQKNMSIRTTKRTVGEMLDEIGIELTEFDKVSPGRRVQLEEKNNVITVEKAFELTLIDGGTEQRVWSTSTTVADFLKREDIQLNESDRLVGQMEDLITPNSIVQVVRVEKVTDVVEEATNFAVETRNDKSLLKGLEKVVQEGKKGKVSRKYEVVKEDGEEIARTVLEEQIINESQKKIVAVGSKVVVASASTAKTRNVGSSGSGSKSSTGVGVSRDNSVAPAGGKEFYVTATAYTAGCNGCSGITATGINLKVNPNLKVIAVDPKVIPLGSKVWVEGYGYAVAGDTGGSIKGLKIDLHVPTKQAAFNFGRRQVKVKVIN